MSDDSLCEKISYFRDFGFFSEYGDDSPAQILEDLRKRSSEDADFVLFDDGGEGYQLEACFLASDTSRMWLENPSNLLQWDHSYSAVIKQWAEISRGAFVPYDVQETWETAAGPIKITFSCNGSLQTLTPKFSGATFDMGILDRINDLISTGGIQLESVKVDSEEVIVVALTGVEKQRLHQERGWKFYPRYRCTEAIPWLGFPGMVIAELFSDGATDAFYLGRTLGQLEAVLRLAGWKDTTVSTIMVTVNQLRELAEKSGGPISIGMLEFSLGFESPEENSSYAEGGAPQFVASAEFRGVPRLEVTPLNYSYFRDTSIAPVETKKTPFPIAQFGLKRSELVYLPPIDPNDGSAWHRWLVGLLETATEIGVNRLVSEFVRISTFLANNFPDESLALRRESLGVHCIGWTSFTHIDKGSYTLRVAPIKYQARLQAEAILCEMYNRVHRSDFSSHLQETETLYRNELWHILTLDVPAEDLQTAGWTRENSIHQGVENLRSLQHSLSRLGSLAEDLAGVKKAERKW